MATVTTCAMDAYTCMCVSTSFKMLSCLSLAVSDTSWEIMALLSRLSGRGWGSSTVSSTPTTRAHWPPRTIRELILVVQ